MRKCPKFVLSLSEVAEVCPKMTFEMFPVALPSFQSRVHSVHTTLKTPCKRMATAIPLLLPTLAQENTGEVVQKSVTQILPESKPHAQKLLTQFLRHLPTHHPEIETNRTRIPLIGESEIWKETTEKKEARIACHYIQRAVCCKRGVPRGINMLKIKYLLALKTHWKPRQQQTATTLQAIEFDASS
jgi:hypothetical protein